MRSRTLWIVALVAAMAIAPAMARKEFIAIEGGEFVVPSDVSADGSKFVLSGYFGSPYFTWTAEEGLISIGGGGSGQVSISDDGSTIVGTAPNASGQGEAARYDGNGMWTLMGSEPGALPCGSSLSSAYDTNNDTAVGLFWRAQVCKAIGGTWDVIAGVAGPTLESGIPDRSTRGNGINDDGSIIVGWADQADGFRTASKWVNGIQEFILDDEGRLVGEALGVNSDGTVIYGFGWQGDFGGTGQGWLWREGQGMIPMGVGAVGRNIQSPAIDATEDGSTVIGIYRDFDNFIQFGWIWREKFGWQSFDDFLKGWGPRGWSQMIPSAMSADGNIIGGYGINPDGAVQAWILNLKANK